MIVKVLKAAEEDAIAAAVWYDKQAAGLGDDFLVHFRQALSSVESDPQRFPVLECDLGSSSLRRCPFRRFPYYLVFEIRSQEVLILAVAHAKRRPGFWTQRGN